MSNHGDTRQANACCMPSVYRAFVSREYYGSKSTTALIDEFWVYILLLNRLDNEEQKGTEGEDSFVEKCFASTAPLSNTENAYVTFFIRFLNSSLLPLVGTIFKQKL